MSEEEDPQEESHEQQPSAGAFYASALNAREGAHLVSWSQHDSRNRDSSIRAGLLLEHAERDSKQSFYKEAEWAGAGIGYKLLRKAGYKGQGGLGAREQGTEQPLVAWKQSGKEGIGSRAASCQGPQMPAPFRLPAKSAPGILEPRKISGKEAFLKADRQEASSRARLKRRWPSVRVEEDLDSKIKRWTQILQAEADDKAGKEVDQYMFRLFRDDSALDTNPLTRDNNLSLRNPLL